MILPKLGKGTQLQTVPNDSKYERNVSCTAAWKKSRGTGVMDRVFVLLGDSPITDGSIWNDGVEEWVLVPASDMDHRVVLKTVRPR
jgi:hypothetical protein